MMYTVTALGLVVLALSFLLYKLTHIVVGLQKDIVVLYKLVAKSAEQNVELAKLLRKALETLNESSKK